MNNKYFRVVFKRILSILYYITHFWLYKKIRWNTHIMLTAHIHRKGNVSLGYKSSISHGVTINCNEFKLGNNSQLNPNVTIYGNVIIGCNVMIAPSVMIAGGNHNFSNRNIMMINQGSTSKGIEIDDDVWIGANSVILDGVKIGRGSIIGAGSVVTKDIVPYSINFGNPCKYIKSRI